MRFWIVSALTLAACAPGTQSKFANYGTVITTTTLDASSSSFSFANQQASTDGTWDIATVWVTAIDADNGVSAITMSCTGSKNNNTTDYTLQSVDVSAGVGTSTDASWVKNPGANTTRWPWRIDIAGFPSVECTFTDTGGDASDSIAVDLSLAMEG